MAEHTHLDLIAVTAMGRETAVASVAILVRNHAPARLHRAAIHGKGKGFVDASVRLGYLQHCAGIEGDGPRTFDPHRRVLVESSNQSLSVQKIVPWDFAK
jgi:hypothetical protein